MGIDPEVTSPPTLEGSLVSRFLVAIRSLHQCFSCYRQQASRKTGLFGNFESRSLGYEPKGRERAGQGRNLAIVISLLKSGMFPLCRLTLLLMQWVPITLRSQRFAGRFLQHASTMFM